MARELTGRKFAGIIVGGFAIVIAVNFTMATFATRGFSGTVVDNSYVASQKFNTWLEQAEAQDALGWTAEPRRRDGKLAAITQGVPTSADVRADIRRPLGEPDPRELTLTATAPGEFMSHELLPDGRWIVRLTITADGKTWVQEEQM